MNEMLAIWHKNRIIGWTTAATLRPGEFFWSIDTGAMNYAPTAVDAAKAARKRYVADVREARIRASAHILDTYNTRKKIFKKRFAKKGT